MYAYSENVSVVAWPVVVAAVVVVSVVAVVVK